MTRKRGKDSLPPEGFLTVPQFARYMNCSPRTVWRSIADEELKVERFRGLVRIDPSQLRKARKRKHRKPTRQPDTETTGQKSARKKNPDKLEKPKKPKTRKSKDPSEPDNS